MFVKGHRFTIKELKNLDERIKNDYIDNIVKYDNKVL